MALIRSAPCKVWSFRDILGSEVWCTRWDETDTPEGMMDYWHDFIKDEEYQPEVTTIVLEEIWEKA